MAADAAMGLAEIEQLFDELVARQRLRVQEIARRIDPRITDDDLLSPEDVPALRDSPAFAYEDGQLAGLLASQMALRVRLRARE